MGKKVIHPNGGHKLTQQHMLDAVDPNKIMEKYHATGLLRSGRQNGRQPMFLNMTGDSYHEMLVKVQEVQGQFSALPAKIRKRFSHNPANLLRFIQDKNNLEEAIELGLVSRDGLSDEMKDQLDLVDQADAEDYREFQEWKKRNNTAPPAREDEPAPSRADDEAQPSYRKGGTPSKRGKGGRTS